MSKQDDLQHYEGHEKNSRLYIGNLDYKTTIQDIRKVFGNFGEILSIQIKTGFCFVEYENPQEAKVARENMNLKMFNKRTIIVRPACNNISNILVPKVFYSDDDGGDVIDKYEKYDKRPEDKLNLESFRSACFYCGNFGHWKKDCLKRLNSIEGKKEEALIRARKNKSRSKSRSKKRKEKKKLSRSNSPSLYSNHSSSVNSDSIPSSCESCKRILRKKRLRRKDFKIK